tara:strand:- start:11879 stop:12652 length:774 start_codon:yes stop_codon:yes gene_type:complete
MKIISFNANGIRSAAKKGFFDWLEKENADIVCIQETKAQEDQLKDNSIFYPYEYCYYVSAQKKGYSGVAIYSKLKPINVIKNLGFDIADNEGRFIQLDFENFSVVSLYLPSGTSGDERQNIKYKFLDKFETDYLNNLIKNKKKVIMCGDFNIAHKNEDLKNWKPNQKNSGFLPKEREWLDKIFYNVGFVDVFREVNQEKDQYTWWSNRGKSWDNNVGWRIDYHIVTPNLKDKIQPSNKIYRDIKFSDHAPLILNYDL